MKHLTLLLVCSMLLTVFACEQDETGLDSIDTAFIETQNTNRDKPTHNKLHLKPISELFPASISNGFAYIVDNAGQAFTFLDGKPVCKADYPGATFVKTHVKSTAKPGIYVYANGDKVTFFDGNLSFNTKTVSPYCQIIYEATGAVIYCEGDIENAYFETVYVIENCYLPGFFPQLVSSDTINVLTPDCPLEDWETAFDLYGDFHLINPNCF